MDGARTVEGGKGVTGAMIRARIRVDGRLAGGLLSGILLTHSRLPPHRIKNSRVQVLSNVAEPVQCHFFRVATADGNLAPLRLLAVAKSSASLSRRFSGVTYRGPSAAMNASGSTRHITTVALTTRVPK